MPLKLGVDVGGTFTDLLLFDEESGRQVRAKTPSTPADPAAGVLVGIDKVCRLAGVAPGAITHIMHGTTVATNAVLEGKGAKVGLITTQGFKQILHLARSWTPGPLAGWIIMVKPEPPAALEHTREAQERIDTRGNIVVPLDEEALRQTLQDLVSRGIEALTVSLINSYANPVHEKRIKAIAQEMFPTLPITASAEVLPEFREYERALTAVMNSYVRPKVASYMRNFAAQLAAHGLNAEVNILRSDAGLMTLSMAQERPVYGVMSGPAGGVAGALFIATKAGFPNILTLDMGGTSTDVSLCQDGAQTITRETTLGYFPIKVPSVDVRSIGAGGGSIAHVPEITKALRVGPQSAGADPGPACYGKGGTEATVTDANLVLGHLPPRLLGGEMALDQEAATAAVERIGHKLGLDVYRAAQGILDIVNENMHGALRLVSVQRGYDPRNFALVAFGGAGPLHANAVAKLIGSFPVIVPPAPGILCATGDVCCDYREEFARTVLRTLEQISVAEVTQIFANLGEEAAGWLEREGIPRDQQQIFYNADMRYFRQGYELPLIITLADLQTQGTAALANRFHSLHEQLYRFRLDAECEIVNLRAVALGKGASLSLPEAEMDGPSSTQALSDEHRIYFDGKFLSTPIYDRAKLRPGNRLTGPAIVTEMDSTTVILPDFTGEVDRYFNMLIRPGTTNK
ncbi:MAG: hydantoinase/oxoprolinase family protein [Deltaproteobacteria bacterium]|nr:hydantoinase/oxoprolinase family protein [Deltaproteobacteria bacterium]